MYITKCVKQRLLLATYLVIFSVTCRSKCFITYPDSSYDRTNEKSPGDTQEPDTSRSRSQRVINTSGHMVSRSDTFQDGRQGTNKHIVTPRWQSRWETAMRPDPRKAQNGKQKLSHVSVPEAKTTPLTVSNVTSQEKNAKRRDSKTKPRAYRRGVSLASDNNKENEQFERTSVKSTEVDKLQMLHKTWARSDNICTQTQRLWKFDTDRRTNLFLSDDAFIKDVNMKEVVPLPGEYEEMRKRRRFIRIRSVNVNARRR